MPDTNDATTGRPLGDAPRGLRSWPRRILRWLLLLAVALLAPLLAGLVLLHLPVGRAAVKKLVEEAGGRAAGGQLRLGTLDYSLPRGRVDVAALDLRTPGLDVRIQETHLRYGLRDGLRLALARPVIVVRDTGEAKSGTPATGLAARPWAVLDRFSELSLADGRVELQDPEAAPYLVLAGLDATVAPAGGRREVVLALREGTMTFGPESHLGPLRGEGRLSTDGGTLRIDSLRLGGGGSAVEAKGSLSRLSPSEGSLTCGGVIDARLVHGLAPATADLAGRVEATAEVRLDGDEIGGTLGLTTAPSLAWARIGPLEGAAKGRFDLRQLTLESLDLQGFSGRLHASGPLAIDGESKTDVALRAEGLDVRAIAKAAAEADLPLRSAFSGSIRWTTKGFDVELGRAEGAIALAPLPISPARNGEAPGLPLAGGATLAVAGRALRLSDLELEARGVRATGALGLSPDLAFEGQVEGYAPLAAANAVAADLGAPPPPDLAGDVSLRAHVHGPAKDPVAELHVTGAGLAPAAQTAKATLSLEGDMRYAAGRLEVETARVRSGEGEAVVEGALPLTASGGAWDLHGEARALDLALALAMAGIEGHGATDGRFRVEGEYAKPRAQADLEARVALAGEDEPAVVSASGTFADGRLDVTSLDAQLAGGRIEGQASFDTKTRALGAKATASDMRLARLPLVPDSLKGLDGAVAARIELTGTPDAPSGEARVSLADATLDGRPLPGIALEARADGGRLQISGASSTGDASSTFLRGEAPFSGDWPVRLEVDVAALPGQAVLDALVPPALAGATIDAQGKVVVETALREPKPLRYRADGVAARGRVGTLEWSAEPFVVEGTADEATLTGLRLTTAASTPPAERARPDVEGSAEAAAPAGGTLAVDGRIPFTPAGRFDLSVKGKLAIAAGEALLPDSRLGGEASLEVQAGGTLSAPELMGTFGIVDGRGRYEGARVSAVQVSGHFAGREAVIDDASARVLGGRFVASGSVPLAALDAGHVSRLRFSATDLDLARLAVPFAERGAETPSFFLSVDGELEAAAPRLDALRGRGQFTRVESKTREGSTALAAPAAWSLADGKIVQETLRFAGPLGTLEASAEATLLGESRGKVVLAGPLDLRLVSPFVPDTTLAGPARIDLRARWGDGPARLDGSLALEDGRVTLETLAFTASQIKGEVRFLGDRAEVDATAAAGDGKITAYGGMSFAPRLLGPAALTIEAERVPIAYPEGFRGRATGGVLVEGDAGRYRVSGLVDVSQAYYTAEFDAEGQSLGRLDYQLTALSSQDSIADHLPLAVDIRLKDPLRIRNQIARLDIVGTITASGTLAQPVANGQVSLLSGGELTVRRARVRPQEGRIELNGYPGGVPTLDFAGLTHVGGVTINLQARGALDDLELDVSSPNRPDLSQTDLLSLILTGRTAQAAASEGKAIVAEELASALGGVLQKSVGDTFLVDVSSDESMLLDEGDPSQRFRVGTKLSHNFSVIYSTRLDGTQQRWISQWTPRSGRFTIRFIDDRQEGQAVEATDRRTFNVFPRQDKAKPSADQLRKLDALRFEGRLPLPEGELRRAADLKVGRRYDPLQFVKAADKVRALLVEHGYRGAAVEEGEGKAARKGHVELVLEVEAGPRVVLSWRGDDPGEKARKRATESWPAYASPEAAASQVARAIRVDLQARGFYEAKVTHEVRATADEAEVVIDVRQGPAGSGVDVRFDGNRALTREALLATLPKPGSHAFFDDLDRPARLLAKARVAYAGVGYLRPRLSAPRARFDAATGRLEVTVRVREGTPSVVGRLTLPEEVTQAGPSGPALKLREGAPFDVGAYVDDRDAIAAWYRQEGYAESRVRGVLEPSGHAVGVTFAADPGPRPDLRDVRIASDGRTKESMVRRSLHLEPGSPILPQQLAETRTRLAELGTFSTIDLRTVPVDGRDDLRDVEVSYVERPDLEVEYGLRYNASTSGTADPSSGPSEGRLQVAAAATLSNVFGWGWRLTGFTLQTTTRHNYRAGVESSTLFGLRVKSQFLYFDETLNESAIAASFASKVRGFTLQQRRALLSSSRGQRWHDLLSLQWGYTKKNIKYSEEVGSDVLVSGDRAFLSVALIGDWRDSLTDPHKGVFWTATTEWARQFLGSDVDYQRYYGQLFAYLPLPGGIVWAQGYRGGVVPGDDPFYLLENRFQSGGPTTVRGFRQNGLGPQFDENEGFGGQGVFVFNQELRFPIWKRLHGGVFWDAGNTWLLANEFSLRDLRHTVGGGLRIMFPFGPIRLEYGFILDRRKNSDGSYVEPLGRFVFGLGHAF